MTTPYVKVHNVTVKGIAVYTCGRCKKLGMGGAVHLELQSPEDINRTIKRIQLPRNQMPAGWQSYASAGYRCDAEACKI